MSENVGRLNLTGIIEKKDEIARHLVQLDQDIYEARTLINRLESERKAKQTLIDHLKGVLDFYAHDEVKDHLIRPDSMLFALVAYDPSGDPDHELVRMLLGNQTIFEYVEGWENNNSSRTADVEQLCSLWQHLEGVKLFFEAEEAWKSVDRSVQPDFVLRTFTPKSFHMLVYQMVEKVNFVERS